MDIQTTNDDTLAEGLTSADYRKKRLEQIRADNQRELDKAIKYGSGYVELYKQDIAFLLALYDETKAGLMAALDKVVEVEKGLADKQRFIRESRADLEEILLTVEREQASVRALVDVITNENVTDYGDICPGKMHEALQEVRKWLTR